MRCHRYNGDSSFVVVDSRQPHWAEIRLCQRPVSVDVLDQPFGHFVVFRPCWRVVDLGRGQVIPVAVAHNFDVPAGEMLGKVVEVELNTRVRFPSSPPRNALVDRVLVVEHSFVLPDLYPGDGLRCWPPCVSGLHKGTTPGACVADLDHPGSASHLELAGDEASGLIHQSGVDV